MSRFTDEQQAAIFTDDRNLIVVAGAGSGKTRVLVERYLYLLDANRDWPLNALVAITFTREAALEMRDRVRQSLEQRVQSAGDSADRAHWARLLGQMDSARIDTIHALCASILRANAAAARVDPRFEVLEPIAADALLADVIDAELRAIALDDDPAGLTHLFTEYDLRDIKALLAQPDLLQADLTAPDSAATLIAVWQERWQAAYWHEVTALTARIDWQLPPDSPAEDRLGEVCLAVDQQWTTFTQGTLAESLAACQTMIGAIDLRGGSAKNWGDKDRLNAVKDELRTLRDALKHLQKLMGDPPADSEIDRTSAALLLRWYRLLQRIQTAYQAAKAEDAYFDFNDLEQRAADLLRDHPDVRDRYRGREFKHVLVDEFQDTNAAQWQIIQALVDLDNDNALFLVGDPKQSIYGFRGADVSVFDRVQRQIAAHHTGQRIGLTTSFRSHPALIAPFNALFKHILTRDESSPVAAYQVVLDAPMSAFREAAPDPDATHYAPLEFLLPGDSDLNSAERRQWEAYEIARRLQALVASGAPIFDKERDEQRAFQYGDAALLFQSTTHITVYEAVFKALDIPFVTVAGRGYYDRQEVWDVLNALRALYNPADNLSLAAALRSPMFGFSDELLLILRRVYDPDQPRKPIALRDALAQPPHERISDDDMRRVVNARQILYDLSVIAGRVTIAELLRLLLNQTGYLATLTGLPGGARLRRNVEKLVEMADSSGKTTLGAFSHYLTDLSTAEVREGEAALDSSGAVRLMTVHASKGLEFPLVVLVDSGWQRRGGGGDTLIYDAQQGELACKVYDPEQATYEKPFAYRHAVALQQQREEAERKRLLYVAATRARDALIVSGEIAYSKKGDWRVRGWLAWLLDALDITSDTTLPADGDTISAAGTSIRFHLPDYDSSLRMRLAGGDAVARWPTLQASQDAAPPPLTQPVMAAQSAMIDHIAATQLAHLGGLNIATDEQEITYYQRQLRRQLFDDTSGIIHEAARIREPRILRRHIGEVVHEALRYWRFPDENPNIDSILRSYAWQQQITDSQQIEQVVRHARSLLTTFQSSPIYHEMRAVREAGGRLYTEMPFIYRTEKRIIHGVIDVLYERAPDDWVLVDYKTSIVRGARQTLSALDDHARRYHLQIGAYAAAAQAELGGILPAAMVHYIHYTYTVTVPPHVWQPEIAKLETYIGRLIGDTHAQTTPR